MNGLPPGWTRLRIEEIADINPGPSTKAAENSEVSFLAMADLSDDGKVVTQQRRRLAEVRNGFTYFENGDVLVAKITPCFENGKGALVRDLLNGRGFGSTEFHVLRAKDCVDPEFLFLVTRTASFRSNGEKYMVGSAGQKRVPTEFLRSYHLSVPSKPEQKRLIDIFTVWDAGINAIERLRKAKIERKRGLMQRVLTGKVRFKEFRRQPWRRVRIGSVLEPRDRYIEWDDGKAYQFASIRRRSGGLFNRGTFYGREVKTKVLKLLQAGDFVISKRQVVHGAWSVVTKEFQGFGVSDEYDVLVSSDPNVLDINFFNYLSRMPDMYHKAYLAGNGVHIEKLIFNFRDFAKEQIKIPPTAEEQARIVELLAACDEEIKLLQEELEAVKEQKRGLIQELLTGKTPVRVPKGARV
jgi:type I restriction enzyme, S subunit